MKAGKAKSGRWKTYRTRFLVKAKQLSASLSFVDPLGRQHYGRKGDYLVESFDGVISIAPRQIFEDIYVDMSTGMATDMTAYLPSDANSQVADDLPVRLGPSSVRAGDTSAGGQTPRRAPTFVSRKLPQACRDRSPNSDVGYM